MAESMAQNLGPWTGDDFRLTVRSTPTMGFDAALPEPARFISAVAKLVRRRQVESGESADPPKPAVFLLKPKLENSRGLDTAPKFVPMLNNGCTTVNGRIWFVNAVVVTGSYVDFEEIEDAELFRYIVNDLELGSVPAAIFDPRTKASEIRFYRNGLGDPDECDVSSLDLADVSLSSIFRHIDHIYSRQLVTPDANQEAGKLWENSSRYWPRKNAEQMIQLYLCTGLTTAFPTCVVRTEEPDVSGRLDIEIEEVDPIDRSVFVRHAILELKVLRSYSSGGSNVSEQQTLDWIQSGVKQAASYRNERDARQAALCCFDMRSKHTGDQCFNHVRDLANSQNVELKVWFIFASSSEYRDMSVTPLKSKT